MSIECNPRFGGHSVEVKNMLGFVYQYRGEWQWNVKTKLGTFIRSGSTKTIEAAQAQAEAAMVDYFDRTVTPLLRPT